MVPNSLQPLDMKRKSISQIGCSSDSEADKKSTVNLNFRNVLALNLNL
jgi:hypothetical protein